jgi:hypothetical protein
VINFTLCFRFHESKQFRVSQIFIVSNFYPIYNSTTRLWKPFKLLKKKRKENRITFLKMHKLLCLHAFCGWNKAIPNIRMQFPGMHSICALWPLLGSFLPQLQRSSSVCYFLTHFIICPRGLNATRNSVISTLMYRECGNY